MRIRRGSTGSTEPRPRAEETRPSTTLPCRRRIYANCRCRKFAGGAACFLWATFPNITEGIKVLEAWGFTYKTAAFVWIKTYAKSGRPFWGMGAYTRANAEVCLLGVSPGFKAREQVKSHRVHQVIEAPFDGHSKKPDETRRRIVELLGDVPRLEMFARDRAPGWDAWGNEAPPAE